MSVLIISGCVDNNTFNFESYYKSLKNKSIEIPVSQLKKDMEYRICFWVNGECGDCLSSLVKWTEMAEEEFNSNVYFLGFLYMDNNNTADSLCHMVSKGNITLYHDIENSYIVKNQLLTSSHYSTLLLDMHRKVVAIGDPTKSNEIKELFKKKILE